MGERRSVGLDALIKVQLYLNYDCSALTCLLSGRVLSVGYVYFWSSTI